MILNNIKSNQKERGFTIVELLVVIVVIGILAAITIVSYTGITARANTSKAQSNSNSVASVADTYAADSANAGYPSLANLNSYTTMTRVPTGITVIAGAAAALSSTNATTHIIYQVDGTTPLTGACIGYWDTSAAGMAYRYVGVSTTASLNIAIPTCD